MGGKSDEEEEMEDADDLDMDVVVVEDVLVLVAMCRGFCGSCCGGVGLGIV